MKSTKLDIESKSIARDIELRCFIPVIVLTSVAVSLIVGGFFVPPIGIIDGSVIQAVGEIFAFTALLEIPHCIVVAKDKNISFRHGDTEVTVKGCDDSEID